MGSGSLGPASPYHPQERGEWLGWSGSNVKHLLSATLVLTLGIIGRWVGVGNALLLATRAGRGSAFEELEGGGHGFVYGQADA